MAFPMELVRLAREDARFAPHFHLPLQSGSDRVLKRMVRPYRAQDYADLLAAIRRELPRACLGTDVIVGFPGETDAEFEETLELVGRIGLDYVHVFSYSDRSGTPATRLDGKVDPRVIKARSTALNARSRELYQAYLDRQVGRILPSVVLEPDARRPGVLRALSENFCNVDVEGAELSAGAGVHLRALARRGARLVGEPA
jgi:threonylcarbamoyladenosine tRNA methylthiotransferase MtaB